jgi:acetyl-CoA carboxylase carboxyltransferase component
MTTTVGSPLLLDELFDRGTFSSMRTQVRSVALGDGGPAGDGVVCGEGQVCGRRVFAYEQDPKVFGGSLGATHADSICRTLDLARRCRAPVVGVHRSGGARIQEGVAALDGYGRIFRRLVELRDHVPQIAVVHGACAGGAAYGPALMDLVVMPRTDAYLFLTGPDVVREVTGEEVGFDELGGAAVAERSGLASLVVGDAGSVASGVRSLLSYLPSRVGDVPPRAAGWSEPSAELGVPGDARASYDIREVIDRVVDPESFLELRAGGGRSLVVGFGRLRGAPVGVVANQPRVLAGSIDIDASRKGAWFVRLCDRFGLPLAVLVDTPGFLPGTAQERGGVIPAGAEFLSAFVSARVRKVTLIVRKAYGGAFIVMNSLALGADRTYAWPTAEIAVLGARGAVKILERKRLQATDDPESLRAELEDEYSRRFLSPWPAAQAGFVDEVIEPCQTRERLASALIEEA